jgi:hypothetical protein
MFGDKLKTSQSGLSNVHAIISRDTLNKMLVSPKETH